MKINIVESFNNIEIDTFTDNKINPEEFEMYRDMDNSFRLAISQTQADMINYLDRLDMLNSKLDNTIYLSESPFSIYSMRDEQEGDDEKYTYMIDYIEPLYYLNNRDKIQFDYLLFHYKESMMRYIKYGGDCLLPRTEVSGYGKQSIDEFYTLFKDYNKGFFKNLTLFVEKCRENNSYEILNSIDFRVVFMLATDKGNRVFFDRPVKLDLNKIEEWKDVYTYRYGE